MTKLDVLDDLEEIKICVQYELNGKKIDYLPSASEDQFNIKPIYKTFPGWKSKTQGIRHMKDLPENAKICVCFRRFYRCKYQVFRLVLKEMILFY